MYVCIYPVFGIKTQEQLVVLSSFCDSSSCADMWHGKWGTAHQLNQPSRLIRSRTVSTVVEALKPRCPISRPRNLPIHLC